MKISTNTYFSKKKGNIETSFEDRLKDIKKFNFDAVGIYLRKEKISIQKQSELCDKYGLEICYTHVDYGQENLLNNFWLDNEIGDSIEQMYVDQIKEAEGINCKNLVFHLCNSYDAKIGEIGLKRIDRLCKLCAKYNFNFCIENTLLAEKLDYVFDKLNNENLKICYDVGHENAFTPNSKMVEKHFTKITCLHIHDNCGNLHKTKNLNGDLVSSTMNDEHKILGEGTVDIDKLAKKLSLVDENVPLNMEFKTIIRRLDDLGNGANIDIGYTEYDLKQVYEVLKNLENRIYNYKKIES